MLYSSHLFLHLFVIIYITYLLYLSIIRYIYLLSIIVIFYGLRYIYQLYDSPPETSSLLTVPFFWINTGNLFFYCGTFFQMGLNSYIDSLDSNLAADLQIINKALNYTLYIFYFIGFTCRKIFK